MKQIDNFLYEIFKKTKKKLEGRGILCKFPFLTPLYRYASSHVKTNFVEVQGHKMFLDVCDSLRLSKEEVYEKTETNFVKNEIKKDDVVLDIGANIGYYTLIFAKLVGDNGRVYAFEPEPNNFNLLTKNVVINKYSNVNLENIALSNKSGKTKLFLSENNMGMHRIYPSNLISSNYVMINTLTLDDYLKENPIKEKISFIKMDVEGSEFQVLKGMNSFLKSNNNLQMILEFVPFSIRESNNDPKALLNFIKEHCFTISYINHKNNEIEPIENIDEFIQKFEGFYEDGTAKATALICIKN